MKLPSGSFVAAGPVIIEEGKVLLNRTQKGSEITPWFFPGGELEAADGTLEDTCKREVMEEMGLEIEIRRPLKPIMKKRGDAVMLLVHFLATRKGEVTPGENIVEWAWHDIHHLPENCAENVTEVIAGYIAEQS